MDCTNPSRDEIVSCINLFKILSVSNFEPLLNDLGYEGEYNHAIREISRTFLRQILPVEAQIILPKPYIRDGISNNELLEAWSKAFTGLEKIGLNSDVCAWFNKVEYQNKRRDTRLDVVVDAWNSFFYDWCMTPNKYPDLPFQAAIIQKLRIEMLAYRVRLAELSVKVSVASRNNDDDWDATLSEDEVVNIWIHNIARLEYAIVKWISIFTILSHNDLEILENTLSQTVKEQYGKTRYFSLMQLWEYCKSNGYI